MEKSHEEDRVDDTGLIIGRSCISGFLVCIPHAEHFLTTGPSTHPSHANEYHRSPEHVHQDQTPHQYACHSIPHPIEKAAKRKASKRTPKDQDQEEKSTAPQPARPPHPHPSHSVSPPPPQPRPAASSVHNPRCAAARRSSPPSAQ